jgi:eukaryotic-like serine/threonine-protein kinase
MDSEPLGHRYAVIRPIGAGAMTRVFEAWDRDERRPVALKVPVQRLADDRGFLGRLERQVAAVVGFAHPDVAAVYGIHRDGSGGFVVAELVDGSSLRGMLEARGPLPPFGAARVAVRVCAVLAAAHAPGLTHGHLTPTNVLLGIHGQVKLTDFRLAQAARPLAAVPDPDDDLRALGRLLVAMLTGREPAAGERVRLGPEVPPDLAAIVARAAGPQRGYHSAGDLGRDLGRFLAAIAPAAGQAGSPAAPQPPVGAVQGSGAAQPTRVARIASPEPPAGSRVTPSEPPAGRRVARSPAGRHRALRLVAALVGAGLFLVGVAVAVGLAGGEPREPAAGQALTPPSAAVVATTTAASRPATTAPATTVPQRTVPPATTRPAGSGPRIVPDVVGLHRGQATDVLREAQLGVQIVRLQVQDPGQVQRVVAQQPPAGQEVPAQSVVRLTIGTKRATG